MPRHAARPLGLVLGLAFGAGSCAEGITDPVVSPALVEAVAVQGVAFIQPPPNGAVGQDLIACPIAVRVASLTDGAVKWTRVRIETRQRMGGVETTDRQWLERQPLRSWFGGELPAFAADTVDAGLAGLRPFDWELEIFFEAAGRRGESSRRVAGRCGPVVPDAGAAPTVELLEVIGGGAGATAGDTVEIAYRVHAPVGLWDLVESSFLVNPVDPGPLRTFADGPITVDRRRRFVLADRAGVPIDWTLRVRARDLRDVFTETELRIAWDQPIAGEPPAS